MPELRKSPLNDGITVTSPYPPRSTDRYTRVEVRSRSEWRAWLEANHEQTQPIFLVTYKRHHEHYLSWPDQVREALCYGWIDSVRKRVDEDRTSLMMSPRRPKSGWSAVNKKLLEELERDGLLQPAGHAAIERAKANGAWEFLDEVSRLEVPDDLAIALAAQPGARESWDAFPASFRRGKLHWLKQAVRPATRLQRVTTIVDAAREGLRVLRSGQTFTTLSSPSAKRPALMTKVSGGVSSSSSGEVGSSDGSTRGDSSTESSDATTTPSSSTLST